MSSRRPTPDPGKTVVPSPLALGDSDGEGLRIAVRLTPRGGRDALVGLVVEANGRPVLAVRVAAPPIDGAANAALVAFLGKELRLRKADIAIRSGEASRRKIVHLRGDVAELRARLRDWIDEQSDAGNGSGQG